MIKVLKLGRIEIIAKSSSMYTKIGLRHKSLGLLEKLAPSLLYNHFARIEKKNIAKIVLIPKYIISVSVGE